MRVRLLTYNIHGWRTIDGEPNDDAIIRVLAASQADIIGLNEVFYPERPSDRQAGGKGGLSFVAEQLGMSYVFGPCLRWPATESLPERSYGNALLSRWPILASAAHHLTAVEGKEQRGLLEGRILLPTEQAFTVYVTHLDHTEESARLTQLRAVRSWTVRDRNRPHVVMGDFNAIHPWDFEDDPEALNSLVEHPKGSHLVDNGRGPQVTVQMEKAGYTDAVRHLGQPGQRTFIPSTHSIRIDYIWVSEPLVPAMRSAQVWIEPEGGEASDHRPVLADFDL